MHTEATERKWWRTPRTAKRRIPANPEPDTSRETLHGSLDVNIQEQEQCIRTFLACRFCHGSWGRKEFLIVFQSYYLFCAGCWNDGIALLNSPPIFFCHPSYLLLWRFAILHKHHEFYTVFRIRILLIRIRILHFTLNTDPNPGFWWPKIDKHLSWKKKIIFLFIKKYDLPDHRSS